ncbi:MAG: putative leader peptide [Jatrophihabitans sp.]
MGEGSVRGGARRPLLTSRRAVDLCRVGSCLCHVR